MVVARWTSSSTKGASAPAAFLLDREGNLLFQLRGGEVIEDNLVKSMRKLVDVSR